MEPIVDVQCCMCVSANNRLWKPHDLFSHFTAVTLEQQLKPSDWCHFSRDILVLNVNETASTHKIMTDNPDPSNVISPQGKTYPWTWTLLISALEHDLVISYQMSSSHLSFYYQVKTYFD